MIHEVDLPPAVYADMLEGCLLHEALHRLMRETPERAERAERAVPSIASIVDRNTLLLMARDLLDEESYVEFGYYADELCSSIQGKWDRVFPYAPPVEEEEERTLAGEPAGTRRNAHPASAAERVAVDHLGSIHGSYWGAVRDVVAKLPFTSANRSCHERPGQVFFVGAYGHHRYTGLHASTLLLPSACKLLCAFIQYVCPKLQWTTIMVSRNTQLEPHVDAQNAALPSMIMGLSFFQGGQLWIKDPTGCHFEEVKGCLVPGQLLELSGRCYMVSTHVLPHSTRPWSEGDRYVLVAYAIGQHKSLKSVHRTALEDLGFRLPPCA
ncbi:Ovostatin [Symbiodinium sp. CCMP2592]|nr:Ovostatin [Symbiodinium sp. CCMP2592]